MDKAKGLRMAVKPSFVPQTRYLQKETAPYARRRFF